jgi:diguanylate cyclase (GGDEF)-like protein
MPGVAQKRVLVVDDSRFVRTTFNRILSAWFAVREEADGEAGWAALRTDTSIAMVFSDLDMPRLDGLGLIERIRSSGDARIRALPVIVISGSEDESSKSRARAAGANDFISKSADAPEVLARIGALMRLVKPAATTLQLLLAEGERQFSYARRHGTALSVMALRVDSFAAAAASFGERAAGELLARIGKLMASMMRAEDSIALAAAATYVVVSPGTGAPQILAFARRLREQLDRAQVRHGKELVRIQASFGLASLELDAVGSIEALMRQALQRLQAQGGGADVPATAAAPLGSPALPSEVEHALQVLEKLDADHLGREAAGEICRRLASFLSGVAK